MYFSFDQITLLYLFFDADQESEFVFLFEMNHIYKVTGDQLEWVFGIIIVEHLWFALQIRARLFALWVIYQKIQNF